MARRLSHIDLNLLVVLEAVLRHQNVSRAARELGMSQPAASGAIARLRVAFGDELVVRAASGIRPTARAMELSEELGPMLKAMSQMVHGRDFDPATAERTLRLGLIQPMVVGILPRLLAAVACEAPNVALEVVQTVPADAPAALDAAILDVAVVACPTPPAHLHHRSVGEVDLVLLGHPSSLPDTIDLDTFCQLPHVRVVLPGYADNLVDHRLRAVGRTRTSVLQVDSYLAVPWILISNPMVAVVPRLFAASLAPLELSVRPLPEPLKSTVELIAMWGVGRGRAPAAAWLVDRVADALARHPAAQNPPLPLDPESP